MEKYPGNAVPQKQKKKTLSMKPYLFYTRFTNEGFGVHMYFRITF